MRMRRRQRTKEQILEAVGIVNAKVNNGDMSLTNALKEEGLNLGTYRKYSHGETKKRAYKKARKKREEGPVNFQEINVRGNKTLLIITEDQETISTIIASFK